jgi:hypothetical protein
MPILSYAQRQKYWEECRELIDREALYRAGPREGGGEHPRLDGKAGGKTIWQFYLRRAMYNPDFAHRIGLLFWDHFAPVFLQQPFQVCACHPSGVPIGMAIQDAATQLKIPLNLFLVRRQAKHFGIDNWFDGQVNKLPVLMVDDLAASAPFLRVGSARVQAKLNLPLHRNYFVIIHKVGRSFLKKNQHTENMLDNELVALYTVNNIAKTAEEFKIRYNRLPRLSGLVK